MLAFCGSELACDHCPLELLASAKKAEAAGIVGEVVDDHSGRDLEEASVHTINVWATEAAAKIGTAPDDPPNYFVIARALRTISRGECFPK